MSGPADDDEKLEALFTRTSLESVWLRFFTASTRPSRREIDRMLDIDGVARMTYVVTRGEDAEEQILAIGNYSVRHAGIPPKSLLCR